MNKLAILCNFAMSAEAELYSPYVLIGIEKGLEEINVKSNDASIFWAFGSGRIGQQLHLERCLALPDASHEAITYKIGDE
jgi:hypothetical protein